MRERTPFPAEVISALPNLKYLLTTGPINRAIDLEACAKQGILVTGTVGPLARYRPPCSTTQHTWALILGLARHIARGDAAVKSGGWQDVSPSSLTISLPGKTLGLLGLGRIGASVAKIGALAFNMTVKAWSSNLTQEAADEKAVAAGLQPGTIEAVGSKEELFRTADVLSIHYVLSPRSRGIVGERELAAMKSTAILVNTSRGLLIDEGALLEALQHGKIKGAALDVFDTEPLPQNSEWRTVPWGKDGRSDVLLSPHMGYCEEEVIIAWYEEQAQNIKRWLDGQEVHTKLV